MKKELTEIPESKPVDPLAKPGGGPSVIGHPWKDHPWIALQPEYEGRVFAERPNCEYPKHSVVEEDGITYFKHLGEIRIEERGAVRGTFWLADQRPDKPTPVRTLMKLISLRKDPYQQMNKDEKIEYLEQTLREHGIAE